MKNLIYLFLFPFILFSQENESNFSFSTSGSFIGQYNDYGNPNSQLPNYNLIFQLNPRIQAYGIPLTADMRYVSSDHEYHQSMNRFNLGFDVNTFKQLLIKKAMMRVNRIKVGGNEVQLDDLKYFNKDKIKEQAIQKLKDKLKTPEALKALEQLKEIKNYEDALNNPAFKNKLPQLGKLKSKYKIKSKEEIAKLEGLLTSEKEKLYELFSLQEKYDKLMDKKKKLIKLTKKLDKYRGILKKIETLENPNLNSFVKDPKKVREFLENYGDFTNMDKWLYNLKTLNFGKSYPYYSSYTVNRVPVTGLDVNVTPGIFSFSFLAGNSEQSLFSNDDITMYDRNIIGGKIGIGQANKSHFNITFVTIEDDAIESLTQAGQNFNFQSNILSGIDFKLDLFSNNVKLESELVQSIHTSNLNTESELSNTDIAHKSKLDMFLFSRQTKVKLSYEHIGRDFRSLASPIMLTDRFYYHLSVNQSFFSNKFQASLFHKQEQDDLVPWKVYQTTSKTSGASLSYQNNGFVLKFNYLPFTQSNEESILDTLYSTPPSIDIKNKAYSVTSSYSYKIKDLDLTSQLSINMVNNKMDMVSESEVSAYSMYSSTASNNIGFNQSVKTKSGIGFNINTTYVINEIENTSLGNENSNLFMLNLSSSFVLFKKWTNSFGMQYANEDNLDNKLGFYYTTSVPVYDRCNLTITARQNQFKDPLDNTNAFTDLFVHSGLVFNF